MSDWRDRFDRPPAASDQWGEIHRGPCPHCSEPIVGYLKPRDTANPPKVVLFWHGGGSEYLAENQTVVRAGHAWHEFVSSPEAKFILLDGRNWTVREVDPANIVDASMGRKPNDSRPVGAIPLSKPPSLLQRATQCPTEDDDE